MATSVQPLIHVGYHKTGTTWLQQSVFARHGLVQPIGHAELHGLLVAPHPLDFRPEEAKSVLLPRLRDAAATGCAPVVSFERLSGNPHSGGYDSKEIADRLASVIPGARILVVIREQRDMILACYKQYIRIGGTCTLPEYLSPPTPRRVPLFDLAHFEYHRLVAYYQELFGQSEVKVMAFEHLVRDQRGFVSEIADFIDRDIPDRANSQRPLNVSLKPAELALRRRFNMVAARDAVNPHVLVDHPSVAPWLMRASRAGRAAPASLQRRMDQRMVDAVARFTEGRYADSNHRLIGMTGMDLADLGYNTF